MLNSNSYSLFYKIANKNHTFAIVDEAEGDVDNDDSAKILELFLEKKMAEKRYR
jgi:hypothetical protein